MRFVAGRRKNNQYILFQNSMQRNITYDIMKGINILLMMLSHLVFPDGLVKQFIYSFHMPLFFILAGIFAKDISTIPSFLQFTNTNAKRLILPYVVTFMLLCILGAIKAISKSNVSIFLRQLLSTSIGKR